MKAAWWISASIALVAQGCTAIPAPRVLDDVDQARESPSVVAAKRDAPAAFAVAEKLRDDAQAAFEAGDTAGAQILGERALAAYEEAVALARVVRADEIREGAAADVAKEEARLAELEKEHQKMAADVAAIEERLKVLRALEPPSPSGPAGPAREEARWQAVSSLHLGASLLCAAAQMLTQTRQAAGGFTAPPSLAQAKETLAELQTTMADKPQAAPIDMATRARARCLTALTEVRRGAADPKKAAGTGDALLEELSLLGHGSPQRDDRGVVVTLRGLFDGDGLSKAGQKTLEAIAKVGKNHQRFPVMVVLHDKQPLDDTSRARGKARGDGIVALMRSHLGDGRVGDPHLAGDAWPLVSPSGANSGRNQRVDVVFVSPEAL